MITPVLYKFLSSGSPKAMLDIVLRRDVTNASTSAPSSETFLLLAVDCGGFVEEKGTKRLTRRFEVHYFLPDLWKL